VPAQLSQIGRNYSLIKLKKFPVKYRRRASGKGHKPPQFRGLGDSPQQLSEGRRSQFPVFFPVSREMGLGEGFDEDSIHHHSQFNSSQPARLPGKQALPRCV
jgi:hypothetical protein